MIELKCSNLQNGVLYVLSMSVHPLGVLLENWYLVYLDTQSRELCILWLIVQPEKINDAGRNVNRICFGSLSLDEDT